MTAFLTCELCHGHGYEQTEDGKEECSACNSDGETLREHGRDEMSEKQALAQQADGPYHLMVGDWKDEHVALHSPDGHVVGGLTPAQGKALVEHLNAMFLLAAHSAPVAAPVAYLHVPHDHLKDRVRPVASTTRYDEGGVYAEVLPLYAVSGAAHPDDLAVDRFAAAMKAKMAASRAKGRSGWDDPGQCPAARLQTMLLEHLCKGDTVDVGNFAMMLFNRNAPVTAPRAALPEGWKLVPTESFSAMDDAGAKFLDGDYALAETVYRAMLAAAPEAPAAVPPLQISPSSDAGAVTARGGEVGAGLFKRNASGVWEQMPRGMMGCDGVVILYHAEGWPGIATPAP